MLDVGDPGMRRRRMRIQMVGLIFGKQGVSTYQGSQSILGFWVKKWSSDVLTPKIFAEPLPLGPLYPR
jgi:hypothetical protein